VLPGQTAGQTTFAKSKGTFEGGFPSAGDDPLAGKVPAGKSRNGKITSGLELVHIPGGGRLTRHAPKS